MANVPISVVIPTYNREDLLEYTLHSLVEQSLSRDLFEVVIVDDGSASRNENVVNKYSDRLNIKYFWQPDKGFRLSKARNIGIAIAEGDYIVFIDTGILLGTKTLEVHLQTHQNSTYPVVVIGYVYAFEVSNEIVERILPIMDHENVDRTISKLKGYGAYDIRKRQYDELGSNITNWPAPFDIMWGCHFSVERTELLKAGLFDENFSSWGGEDVDLGVRLFQNENMFLLEEKAESIHWPHKKIVSDHFKQSALAAQRIHRKYNLWTTSFYGLPTSDEKYSLNKAIKQFRSSKGKAGSDNVRQEESEFISSEAFSSHG